MTSTPRTPNRTSHAIFLLFSGYVLFTSACLLLDGFTCFACTYMDGLCVCHPISPFFFLSALLFLFFAPLSPSLTCFPKKKKKKKKGNPPPSSPPIPIKPPARYRRSFGHRLSGTGTRRSSHRHRPRNRNRNRHGSRHSRHMLLLTVFCACARVTAAIGPRPSRLPDARRGGVVCICRQFVHSSRIRQSPGRCVLHASCTPCCNIDMLSAGMLQCAYADADADADAVQSMLHKCCCIAVLLAVLLYALRAARVYRTWVASNGSVFQYHIPLPEPEPEPEPQPQPQPQPPARHFQQSQTRRMNQMRCNPETNEVRWPPKTNRFARKNYRKSSCFIFSKKKKKRAQDCCTPEFHSYPPTTPSICHHDEGGMRGKV
ncbi:hypothetical protein J3F83DRAFT_21247 [Trichoderma novae-zelandiae]